MIIKMMHGCDALDLHAFKGGKTADQDQKRESDQTVITDTWWSGPDEGCDGPS
jgi:hypothetical protein